VTTLETDRLTMRPPELDDFEDIVALWADPEVVRYIGGKPSTREESWHRLHRGAGQWALHGYGPMMIREKASGRFVGEVGFADFGRQIDPPLGPLEAGWVLAPWSHGKGFATEAMTSLMGWITQLFAGHRAVCMIDVENDASQRVAAKCGFRLYAVSEYRDSHVNLYERTL